MPLESRIILGLDFPNAEPARALVARLTPQTCALKVGKELFTASGPGLVSEFVEQGFRVFLDLKFHDIPNTVAKACAVATRLRVWMLNVHASGGRAMMQAAHQAVVRESALLKLRRPLLIAVTVLTSMDGTDLAETGVVVSPRELVLRLAALARSCGLDGVVCSPQEAASLKTQFGPTFKLVTPGIRLENCSPDDQRRISTPQAAIENGADFLVIGRAVTHAADPLAVLERIAETINPLLRGNS